MWNLNTEWPFATSRLFCHLTRTEQQFVISPRKYIYIYDIDTHFHRANCIRIELDENVWLRGSNASLILRLYHIHKSVNDYIKTLYNCNHKSVFRCYNAFISRNNYSGTGTHKPNDLYCWMKAKMSDLCARFTFNFTHISSIDNHNVVEVRVISQWLNNDDNKSVHLVKELYFARRVEVEWPKAFHLKVKRNGMNMNMNEKEGHPITQHIQAHNFCPNWTNEFIDKYLPQRIQNHHNSMYQLVVGYE